MKKKENGEFNCICNNFDCNNCSNKLYMVTEIKKKNKGQSGNGGKSVLVQGGSGESSVLSSTGQNGSGGEIVLNGDVQNGSGGSFESSANENIEEKLENILANVKGIGKVKVMITYSQTNEVIPMYDEDSSSSTTEEKRLGRRNKNCE